MHLRHIDTLLAISETGSFDAAARTLGLTTSAVSQRIKNLEAQAGRVLIRRGNPAVPTTAGEVLVQAARQMALIEAEATNALLDHQSQLSMPLVVNADSLATWFKPVLRQVAHLRIFLEDETASLDLLRRGDCVGAITTEARPVTGCDSEYLGAMSYVPAAAPSMAQQFAARQVDWDTMPIVRFGPKDTLNNEFVLQLDPDFQPAAHRAESHAPTFDAINDMIEAGHGWGMVPASVGSAYAEQGRFVILSDRSLQRALYFQRWKVESDSLSMLSDQIHAAAAVGLS